ncbi:Hypothetical protein PHPALM_13110 [Phytophthora palmivora]|uniref:Uncharacterized protein n=1 Tax=Phytophthora palmivora TaxID=4796 RepID=A0A2P4XY29_9STRA|nr:Hypothetical protein PHPALM_13110 [Phytophthora palmivora]
MVRVPGSSGDSQGFHRESDENATKIKLEPGVEDTLIARSLGGAMLMTRREAQQWTSKRNIDLPQAPAGAPAERNSRYVSPDEGPLAKADRPSSTTTPPASRAASKKKKPNSTRKKLKAPDSDIEDRGETQDWATDKIEQTYYQRELTSFLTENLVMKIMRPTMSNTPQGPVTELIETSNKLEAVQILMGTMKEPGIEPKHFDANVLFDMELAVIQDATATLHKLLEPLTSRKCPKKRPS